MCMTLEELSDHTANLRDCLEEKRRQLPGMTPTNAAFVRDQISCLTPRVDELEAQCAAMRGAAA